MSQQVYQIVTDRILALLEQVVVPWKKPWKTIGGSGAPSNLVSRKPYRGVLIAQGFGSPYWLTFRQAQDRGGHIRRGERGTPIVFWRIDQKTSEDGGGEEGPGGTRGPSLHPRPIPRQEFVGSASLDSRAGRERGRSTVH
jgi:antirestriction protein ArdC